MYLRNIFKVTATDRNKFCINLIESSAPRSDFYFLVILSSAIVTLGLLADNVILVIGGMMVAPVLSPVLAIALGLVINDSKVIFRSIKIFFVSFIFSFIVSLFLGIFTNKAVSDISLIQIMRPDMFYFFVALIAGFAASYTWVKSGLNETLPGVAVTVTLIPPLVAIGLAMADRDWLVFDNTLKVLLINLAGIIFASLLVFSLMDFYKCKKKIHEEVKEEEKEIQKEKEKIEKEKIESL